MSSASQSRSGSIDCSHSQRPSAQRKQLTVGIGALSRSLPRAGAGVRSASAASDAISHIAVLSSDTDTCSPRPVRCRAKSAAHTAPASADPLALSPIPPAGCGGVPALSRNSAAIPE